MAHVFCVAVERITFGKDLLHAFVPEELTAHTAAVFKQGIAPFGVRLIGIEVIREQDSTNACGLSDLFARKQRGLRFQMTGGKRAVVAEGGAVVEKIAAEFMGSAKEPAFHDV